MWRITEILAVLGLIFGVGYYTYIDGWTGLMYGVLAGLFGGLCVYWFGDMMPVIGPLLRKKASK